jgi:hypothetical protein
VLSADEIVAPVTGWWSTPVEAPACDVECGGEEAYPGASPTSYGSCYQELTYSAELFLNLDDPSVRGVRSLSIESQTVWCQYADPCGGAALFSTEFPVE